MLRANDIAPRNPEPVKHQENTLDTPPPSENSSGKEERSEIKKETESGEEDDDSDDDRIREKALLVRFYILCSKLLTVYH